ncbi:hypothetical protein H0H93_016797, partial [Arthromyces matolae]
NPDPANGSTASHDDTAADLVQLTHAGRLFIMFRAFFWVALVACSGLVIFSIVKAGSKADEIQPIRPIHGSSFLDHYGPSDPPNHPFPASFPPHTPFIGPSLENDFSAFSNKVGDSDQTLQPRWIAQVVKGVVEGVMKIVDIIKDKIAHDVVQREAWTQSIVEAGRKSQPKLNWIVVFTKIKHHTTWIGKKDKYWWQRTDQFSQSIGGKLTFDIYSTLCGGVFILDGDGGPRNWYMDGNFNRTGYQGHTVTFSPMWIDGKPVVSKEECDKAKNEK